jgi:hypothetical protein
VKCYGGWVNWFKFHRREVILGAVIFLVSSLSFALGYLANREFNHIPIIIQTSLKENPP